MNRHLNPFIVREGDPGGGGGAPTPGDSGAIVQMRQQIDALTADLKAVRGERDEFRTKLTTIEREKMGDIERLTTERDDLVKEVTNLRPLRDHLGRFETKFNTLYEQEWKDVPDDVKPRIEPLVGNGDPAERYDRLLAAKALLTASVTKGGTVTDPALPGAPGVLPPGQKPPLDAKQAQSMRWGDAFTAGA